RAGSRLALVDLRGAYVADTARDHDRLVIAAPFTVRLEQARAEVAGEVRAAEFVVELRRADRPFQHDRERRRYPRRPSRRSRFPRLRPIRQLEMRHGKAREARLRPGAAARRPLVADL